MSSFDNPAPQTTGANQSDPLKKPSKKRRMTLIVSIAAAVVLVVGIIVGINVHNHRVAEAAAREKAEQARIYKAEVLKRAYDNCVGDIDTEPALHDSLELGDNNGSLYLYSPDTAVQDYATFSCVAGMTDMPDSVTNKISQTTALDGMQSDEWDNIEATWSYHSGDSLDVTLEIKQ